MTGKSDINIDQTTRLAPVYNGWLSFLQRHLKEEDGFHIEIEDLYAQIPPIQVSCDLFHETRQHKRMALIVTVLGAHQYPSGTCKASRSLDLAFRSKRVNVPVYWLSILRSHFQLGVSHELSACGALISIDWHYVEDTQTLQVFLDELVCSRRSEGLRSQASTRLLETARTSFTTRPSQSQLEDKNGSTYIRSKHSLNFDAHRPGGGS